MNPERFERGVLTAILLVVGTAAGAASFTHVHNWTLANSPAGTAGWFGWANACISELVPIASLLNMRSRRRTGKPVTYPMFLLISAVTLSLAAQLAVAKPGLSGWLLSAVPSLAFIGLSKLVLSSKPADVKSAVLVTPEVVVAEPVVDVTPAPELTPEPVVVEPVVDVTPAPAPARRRRSNAERVRKAAARIPNATPAVIAARTGVSESTARRYMAPAEVAS